MFQPNAEDDICFEYIFFTAQKRIKKRTTTSTGYCIYVCHCTDDVCLVPFFFFFSQPGYCQKLFGLAYYSSFQYPHQLFYVRLLCISAYRNTGKK